MHHRTGLPAKRRLFRKTNTEAQLTYRKSIKIISLPRANITNNSLGSPDHWNEASSKTQNWSRDHFFERRSIRQYWNLNWFYSAYQLQWVQLLKWRKHLKNWDLSNFLHLVSLQNIQKQSTVIGNSTPKISKSINSFIEIL